MKQKLLDTLVIVFLTVVIFRPFSALAADDPLVFVWTVEPDYVTELNITMLRVYQDSWQNPPFTADPLTGRIEIPPNIEVGATSKFWATYYSAENGEGGKTGTIAIRNSNDKIDPVAIQRVKIVGGLTVELPEGYEVIFQQSDQ